MKNSDAYVTLESKFAEIKASHQREIHDVVNRHNNYIIQRDNKDRLNQQHQKERIRKKADQEAKKVCERWFEDRYLQHSHRPTPSAPG